MLYICTIPSSLVGIKTPTLVLHISNCWRHVVVVINLYASIFFQLCVSPPGSTWRVPFHHFFSFQTSIASICWREDGMGLVVLITKLKILFYVKQNTVVICLELWLVMGFFRDFCFNTLISVFTCHIVYWNMHVEYLV